ncbi:39S ribosomal protein L2, mitochondrial [Protopterus annectens]|uniref:39S ribosomal protein L2, mitochondrial n=1 Tax=Protopterus annectens TaxID=7888 RepID=UPI001CFBC709|nr:39S ribosomal protein L2, mitochondrial [Protopterus annectens]
MMALAALTQAFRSLALTSTPLLTQHVHPVSLLSSQVVKQTLWRSQFSMVSCCQLLVSHQSPLSGTCASQKCRPFQTCVISCTNNPLWKPPTKYTIRPIGMKKTGGRDHTGKIRVHGIGGGHKRRYRMIDFHRLRYEPGKETQAFEEKVIEVRYDPCRSADIALVAGGNRKRWIIATENMQIGDIIKTSGHIGRMAVSAKEGDSYPLGALPVGTLINSLEIGPGKGAQCIRAAGTCGVLLRKVNGTAIVQLPSKRQVQVSLR